MSRDNVSLDYTTSDSTDSVQILQTPSVHTINPANGVAVENAFKCKDNTLTIIVNNTASGAQTITFKKGVYQNAILGDLAISVAGASTAVLKIENPSRFEQVDGGLLLDFSAGFTGSLYAFGKKSGLA